jgi:hypothetical protein
VNCPWLKSGRVWPAAQLSVHESAGIEGIAGAHAAPQHP